ncbi:MAG TPA: hypothetical protein PLK14_07175 [Sediminibacterium sp.]|nr:hypothetical protein [Sediminibacterium sp.]HQS54873.1 hypothetical protein [Sediminibacterium sp.]
MKKTFLKYGIALAAIVLMYACSKKDGITNQPYDAYGISGTQGQLKINLAFAYTIDYATLRIRVNGKTVSGSMQSRQPFPGGGYNTRGSNFALYLSVPQGSNTVSVFIPKVGTDTDSIVLYSGTVSVPDNNPYTLHLSDTARNPRSGKVDDLLVKNIINKLDTGFCRFKFVNLIPNLAAVDLYLNGIKIKSSIPYKTATDTFSVRTGVNQPGWTSAITTTWAVRPAGALPTSAATASYASSNGLQSQKVMTIFSMGYATATGTRLPYVAFTLDNNQ